METNLYDGGVWAIGADGQLHGPHLPSPSCVLAVQCRAAVWLGSAKGDWLNLNKCHVGDAPRLFWVRRVRPEAQEKISCRPSTDYKTGTRIKAGIKESGFIPIVQEVGLCS